MIQGKQAVLFIFSNGYVKISRFNSLEKQGAVKRKKYFEIQYSLFDIRYSKAWLKNNMGMLKDLIRMGCQKLIGFDNYLFIFSLINITRIQMGGYEKAFQYFINMLPGEGVILDIGANIGVMTATIARKYNTANVYAFEPIPQNIAAIKRTIRYYQLNNVVLFPIALGNENKEVKMIMPTVQGSKMQGLSHILETDDGKEPSEIFFVPMQRLDDIPALQLLTRITAIKIDAENFEYYVLMGGKELLAKHLPLVYCELWNDDRRSHCIRFMQQLGYRVKLYDKGQLVNFTGQPAINFFFLP